MARRGEPLSAVVADADRLHRDALSEELERSGIAVVGAVASHEGVDPLVRQRHPRVVVASCGDGRMDGIAACAAAKRADDLVRVLVVADRGDGDTLLAAVEAGADGFVERQAQIAELVAAVRSVARGEAIVPGALLGGLLSSLISRNRQVEAGAALLMRLTRREREVLQLLVEGCDHETVADILVISPQTARTHIQNVLTKLEVHSRVEAAALAIEHGFFDRPKVGR